MAANVESMFYVRETPWHGLGTRVESAPTSKEALKYSGLSWKVRQEDIKTVDGYPIHGYRANVRNDNHAVLGVVSDRYKIVQNDEAFAFTDSLLGEGVTYETAGSLSGGKRVWLLAKLPDKYKLMGEEVTPYLVFTNSHDGSGAIRVAATPVRVVCNNTLNLALDTAKRSWSVAHKGDIQRKLDEARNTLFMADQYLKTLQKEAERLSQIRLSDKMVKSWVDELLPVSDNASIQQEKNILRLRRDLQHRYFDAPDLTVLPKSGWRFINAVSDFATHAEPLRKTEHYKENLFSKTMDGHPMIDQAMKFLAA
ncbi:MAG: DUF945 domain-containing protein [Peptococcaceae bacterium]|nr:DUF945 domain-containing protein [Peptococcaceae bacterium]